MSTTPFDQALIDFQKGDFNAQLNISSDLSEDDEMDVAYYFRKSDELPKLEQLALTQCTGKILDVGACVGAHSIPLHNMGKSVKAIDISEEAVNYLKNQGIDAEQSAFMHFKSGTYDTLLFMMNGIGIAETIENLPQFLSHCKSLLKPGGKIICDSTDVKYFYEDDEGGLWMDLNSNYYGEFRFRMDYKQQQGEWFNWLYIDFDTLKRIAEENNFKAILLKESDGMYLAELLLEK